MRRLCAAILAVGSTAAVAATPAMPVVSIVLKDHRFEPAQVTVPAGQKVRVEVTNRDATADDFDSESLRVDRDVKPHERVAFVIGPLKPGRYPFKGELHPATAVGEIIAVEQPHP